MTETDGNDATANSHFRKALASGEFPFLDLIEAEPVEIRPGRAVWRVTVLEKHLRSLGIVHGGVTATLLDTALGFAGALLAPDGYHAVTMQLNINFTRIAKAGDVLITTGEIVHAGKKTAVCRGDVRLEDGKLVATASSTIMYLPLPE